MVQFGYSFAGVKTWTMKKWKISETPKKHECQMRSQIAEKQESMQLTENGLIGPGGSPSGDPDHQSQGQKTSDMQDAGKSNKI